LDIVLSIRHIVLSIRPIVLSIRHLQILIIFLYLHTFRTMRFLSGIVVCVRK
jgi:hypothetical protein